MFKYVDLVCGECGAKMGVVPDEYAPPWVLCNACAILVETPAFIKQVLDDEYGIEYTAREVSENIWEVNTAELRLVFYYDEEKWFREQIKETYGDRSTPH